MIIRNTLRKIKYSLGRFISLILIILIGVGFYAGVRQTTPAILDAENQFIHNQNMMDLHLISTLGFSDKDIDSLKELEDINEVTGGYSEYVFSEESVIRVLSIDKKINKYLLWDGDFPVRNNECLADSQHYKVGDIVSVREPLHDDEVQYLSEHEYKVVGTVTSPLYMAYSDYGSANIGNGELESYILVRDKVFNYAFYTDIYISMNKSDKDVPYSDSYDKKLEKLVSEVESIKLEREKLREDEFHKETEMRITRMIYGRLFDEYLEDGDSEDENGKKAKTVVSVMVNDVVNPDEDIISVIDSSLTDEERAQLEEAKSEALKEVEIPQCKWFIRDRDDEVSDYKILKDQYDEVNALADIIPFFFVIIVFLMTSNTMSRMIAEERLELGTFTSLGYSNIRIISGYLIYVLTATLIGGVSGYFIGVNFIPGFIYGVFPLAIGGIHVQINWFMLVGSLIVAFTVMTTVSVLGCMKALKEKPAYLLRPVVLRGGQKLILERIRPIWMRMTFSWKTTFRNMSRNNRRVLMTVIGVGGCTFLIFIGFALRDCISHVGDKQFSELHHYDLMIIVDAADNTETAKNLGEAVSIDDTVKEAASLVEKPLLLRQEVMTVEGKEGHSLDVYLMAVDSESALFEDYFTLRQADSRDIKVENGDRNKRNTDGSFAETGEKLEISDDGVVITPKIAEITGSREGDELELISGSGDKYRVRISGVAENYVSNYIYFSDKLYERIFGEKPDYNTIIANCSGEDIDTVCEKLYDIDNVVNVTTSERVLQKANNGVEGLGGIVVLLVIISCVLAFTVIYNLMAIGISERTREIATLKVLGFTPFETNDYIYRETIIGAVVGIILGLIISPILLERVIDLIGVDNLIFLRRCKIESYIYAVLLPLSFTLLMIIPTWIKLNSINMIESLKSIE